MDKGGRELKRVVEVTDQDKVGVRIHWLYFDRDSPAILEQAGYDYDATLGYNERIGYRAGTTQVFKPFGATRLLELPLHIQDTTLFYPGRLGLTDAQAWELCETLMGAALRFGGVLTVSWHERSLAPERLWGQFYELLLRELQARGAWCASAGHVIQWFRGRRSVTFEEVRYAGDTLRLRLKCASGPCEPRLCLRVHKPVIGQSTESCAGQAYIDLPWAGDSHMEIPLG